MRSIYFYCPARLEGDIEDKIGRFFTSIHAIQIILLPVIRLAGCYRGHPTRIVYRLFC
jgi:hypothetical protein